MNPNDLKQLAKFAAIVASIIETYNEYAPKAETSEWSKNYVNSVVRCFPIGIQSLREILQKTLIELDKLEIKEIA